MKIQVTQQQQCPLWITTKSPCYQSLDWTSEAWMTMLELSGNMFYKIYFRVRELLAGHPECIHSHVFFESIEKLH
jgi:hypothetical protein